MSKFCAKCGKQMQEDDFLCPSCGAIWGDRVYRVPTSFDAEDPLAEDAREDYAESSGESAEQHNETAEKKQPGWLLPVAALILVLAFGLFLIGSDFELWAGEGSTAPSTTAEPTTSPSTQPVLPYTVYTVKFVDPYGTPIPGVGVESLFNVIMDGYLSSSSVMIPVDNVNVTSDENGIATLILYKAYDTDAYAHILSVPRGYDQSMVGYTKYFAEGQTEMLIVLKFSDEPAEPSWGDEESYDYLIRFIDPDGNPVPNVKIYNPIVTLSTPYLCSDSDGLITFKLDCQFDAVVIAEVPEGYSDELVLVPQYFDGGTYMLIVIDYDYTEIDPPDLPTLPVYSVIMDDTPWLYAPVQTAAAAGETVSVKIIYDEGIGTMLFADGQEVTDYKVSVAGYWEYTFTMPEGDVTLELRTYEKTSLTIFSEELIRAYYRLHPDSDDTYVMCYYGEYGDAIVGMLKTHSMNTEPVIETVAGYTFTYPTQSTIQVLLKRQFLSLLEAYQAGYLTEPDIMQISNIHKEYLSQD